MFPSDPDNPLTREGVELGRRLFHDSILSGNRTQACASCHAQPNGFTDHGLALSLGSEGVVGTRNASSLVNLAWGRDFFWDGRAPRLEDQAKDPVADPSEMNLPWPEVLERLQAHPTYPDAFGRAFGTIEITQDRVVAAIAQFERTLISNDSRWDRKGRGEIQFTPEEARGEELFFSEVGECFHCHAPALFTDNRFHDTGLDLVPKDPGFETVTGLASDLGKFRTPTLRNVAVTGPYMHDGRFATLEEVLEHYSSGIQRSPNLDPLLGLFPPPGLSLSDQDKADLAAFLRTLTDESFLENPEYGPPPAP